MRFRFECRIDTTAAKLFAFHGDPGNLSVLMEADAGFRLLHHEGSVRPGCETWFEQTVGPLPIVMGFRHTVYEPETRFGEELIHGPFKRFRHIHEFRDDGAEAILTDTLDLDLPYWLGGEFCLARVVAASVRRQFRIRHEAYHRLRARGLI